ncbi:hypothetical protein CNMCM8694_007629 [Aspergillus lentulus]|nr:hypothetical protein CNMCM8060_009791 [Aspergillus lentulus]KAF4187659.1 hypothetical protein CNMCM7927_003605 [Aspergillus lentulus]KAF4194451.1 hypothetical protein CNMCM8694_007629 [Aspergillus lentulus]
MLSRTTLAAFMAAAAATLALARTNITADVCADPSTSTSCTTKALADSKACTDVCNGNKLCVLSCGCAMYQAYMNCVGESCWNQCNLGKVLQAILNAQKERNACLTNKTTTNVIELSKKYTACGCCEVSTRLSGYVAIRLVRTIVTDKKGQDPDNLPPNGTQTLYNTGAADALTAPPSGSVFTWSQSSVTYTVTASPWKNN